MLLSASMHSRTLPAGRSAVPSSGFSTVAGRQPSGRERRGGWWGGERKRGAGKEGRVEDGGRWGGEEKKGEERLILSC